MLQYRSVPFQSRVHIIGVLVFIVLLAVLFLSTSSMILSTSAQQDPLTLLQIKEVLKEPGYTPKHKNDFLIDKVGKSGIDFTLTREIELQLRKAGANNLLIAAIRNKAPKPLPPPPPPKPSSPNLGRFKFETRTLDEKGKIIQKRNEFAPRFIEEIGDGQSIEMVEIQGDIFQMGGKASCLIEKCFEGEKDEHPAHDVKVETFFMSTHEITQAQWKRVSNLPKVKIDISPNPSKFVEGNRPVEQVSWHEAMEFCERLSKHTGRKYSLPSEAQWEYAARAGSDTHFSFGETITTVIVNYDGNRKFGDAPKGFYRKETIVVRGLGVANSFGLFDMHGNVWEWCLDDYYNDGYVPERERSATRTGPSDDKVIRGGSWADGASECRTKNRSWKKASDGNETIGFRLVTTLN